MDCWLTKHILDQNIDLHKTVAVFFLFLSNILKINRRRAKFQKFSYCGDGSLFDNDLNFLASMVILKKKLWPTKDFIKKNIVFSIHIHTYNSNDENRIKLDRISTNYTQNEAFKSWNGTICVAENAAVEMIVRPQHTWIRCTMEKFRGDLYSTRIKVQLH